MIRPPGRGLPSAEGGCARIGRGTSWLFDRELDIGVFKRECSGEPVGVDVKE